MLHWKVKWVNYFGTIFFRNGSLIFGTGEYLQKLEYTRQIKFNKNNTTQRQILITPAIWYNVDDRIPETTSLRIKPEPTTHKQEGDSIYLELEKEIVKKERTMQNFRNNQARHTSVYWLQTMRQKISRLPCTVPCYF